MTAHTECCSRSLVASPAGVLEHLTGQLNAWFRHQQFKHQVARERRQLLQLTDHELEDLGITRHQAEIEAQSSDLPLQRLRIYS
jgi:uncharacterized protein YjiS (DUF1127 family)